MSATTKLPTIDDIYRACERIKGKTVVTPLLHNDRIDQLTGAKVFFKAENLQITGSFKLRGACNAISRLDSEQTSIVTFSSGNHAQAIARAARMAGKKATVVVPADIPEIKKQGIIAQGAQMIFYQRSTQDRKKIAREFATANDSELIPSYEHVDVISGQGTCGVEIALQMRDYGLERLDMLVCPVSGGGLIAGAGMAIKNIFGKNIFGHTEIVGVEPRGLDDHKRSLTAGKRISLSPNRDVGICDALGVELPGELTFAINRHQLSDIWLVDEPRIFQAMALVWHHLKVVVEPSGAVGLASLLDAGKAIHNKTIVIILSGGNVSREIFNTALSEDCF